MTNLAAVQGQLAQAEIRHAGQVAASRAAAPVVITLPPVTREDRAASLLWLAGAKGVPQAASDAVLVSATLGRFGTNALGIAWRDYLAMIRSYGGGSPEARERLGFLLDAFEGPRPAGDAA